jgi:hypothetical protein
LLGSDRGIFFVVMGVLTMLYLHHIALSAAVEHYRRY